MWKGSIVRDFGAALCAIDKTVAGSGFDGKRQTKRADASQGKRERMRDRA